jgi:NADH-quinone oxidoreductase subunit C
VVYHLFSFKERSMVIFKVILPAGELHVDSLTPLWAGADWLEREVFDLFGVRFDGHPDLRRIMNPESWTGHPLRKDFKHPDLILKPVK